MLMPFAKVNGVLLRYRMRGSGVPIVFIHPPLVTSDVFHRQLGRLSSWYQVIAPDIRGHGQSEAGDRAITYRLLAEDVVGLLDDLEVKKAYVCGFSSGGSVALEAMLSYRERFYGGILVGGMSEVNSFAVRSEIWAATRLIGLRAKRIAAALFALGNADGIAAFRRLYSSAVKGEANRIHEYFECSLAYNCTSRLHEIKAPVLLLYGEKDKRFRSYAKLLHQGLPNNTLHYLKKVSHQIPTKAANQMNAHIREWIDKQDPWNTTRERKYGYQLLHEPAINHDNQPRV